MYVNCRRCLRNSIQRNEQWDEHVTETIQKQKLRYSKNVEIDNKSPRENSKSADISSKKSRSSLFTFFQRRSAKVTPEGKVSPDRCEASQSLRNSSANSMRQEMKSVADVKGTEHLV